MMAGLVSRLRHIALTSARSIWAAEQLAAVVLLALVAWCIYIAGSGWYPVGIQSDFSELNDYFITSGTGPNAKTISRARLLPYLQWLDYDTCRAGGAGKCVRTYVGRPDINPCRAPSPAQCVKPDVPRPQDISARDFDDSFWGSIDNVIRNTGMRQPNPGGVLYHHASVYVPAAHLLKYGLSAPVPYLYGLGSTALYSLVFAVASPTLSTYFNVYPFMMLLGIVSIALTAGYAARSPIVGVAALGLCFVTVCSMGFGFLILSPGFNPMRYVGLSLQVASIFYMFRTSRSSHAVIALLSAMLLSVIWNTEFGLFGIVGQMLALLSPRLTIQTRTRTVAVLASIVLAVVVVVLRQSHQYLLHTNDLMYLGVLTPKELDPANYRMFLLKILASGIALTVSTFFFEKNERHARLCILPILAELLVKYIYIPQTVHLMSSLVFVLPMLLIYAPWPRVGELQSWIINSRRLIAVAACIFLVNSCYPQATALRAAGIGYRDDLVTPFKSDNWQALGETIRFAAPGTAIERRVSTIHAELKPNDSLTVLSPFDFLLSFYTNPKRYCGHFEVMTNLATTRDMNTIAACIRHSPNMLVVYDKALTTDCPRDSHGRALLFIESGCDAKNLYKRDLRSLFDKLAPDLMLVRETANLKLYRPKR